MIFIADLIACINMFRAPLCPSSGAREYYTGGCCMWYLVFWLSSCRYGVELKVVSGLRAAALYNTLELLMMGIMVPETCWASNKICDKNHLLHLVGILFPHINDNARSKPHQILRRIYRATYFQIFVSIRKLGSEVKF